ncbi:dTMP kinase [Methylovirgula sp. HY1]|uniref:dTMP kinase n=1 Tax=Methylovirgula sp. HY1 TaxID=2822761 RepID=UPI001C5AC24F
MPLATFTHSSLHRGAFITLEGGEGTGKTTQARHIAERLRGKGIAAVTTREPGGSPRAEILRDVLLSGALKHLGPETEAIVFSAARIDHIDHMIDPALAAGTWVICDRFADSTRVYQGNFGGVDPAFLRRLEHVTLNGLQPDLTLILDLPPAIGLARAATRRGSEASDRFESEGIAFHEALRQAYLEIAAAEPKRCIVVDAMRSEDEVAQAIWDVITSRLLPDGEPRIAEATPRNLPSQEMASQEMAIQDMANGNVPSGNVPSGDVPTRGPKSPKSKRRARTDRTKSSDR